MRHLILDTETTGLDPKTGHRIIEVAVVEMVDRRHTGRHLHFHVDPEREIDTGATEVHGIRWDDLKGKPRFADKAHEFCDFARGAEWIIHNAPFDIAFLDAEFALLSMPPASEVAGRVIDTLLLAREAFPGKRNSLDALCERFGVDNRHRTLHGALLDAQLLSEVWLALTRGQDSLAIDRVMVSVPRSGQVLRDAASEALDASRIPVVEPTADELAAHEAYLGALDKESGGRCLWLQIGREPGNAADAPQARAA